MTEFSARISTNITTVDSVNQQAQVYGTAQNSEDRSTIPFNITLTPLAELPPGGSPPGNAPPPDARGNGDGTTKAPLNPGGEPDWTQETFDPNALPAVSVFSTFEQGCLNWVASTCTLTSTDGVVHDLSDAVIGYQIEQALDAPTLVQVELQQVGSIDLNPITNPSPWKRGGRLSFTQELDSGAKREVFGKDIYLVDQPDFEYQQGSGQSSLLYGGDIFRLLDGDALGLPEPYCGMQPTKTGDAAELFLELRTGRTWALPDGTPLIEPIPDPYQQNAYGFISDLYLAGGRLVRTNSKGSILVDRFPRFNDAEKISLDFDSLLGPPELSGASGALPYSQVIVRAGGAKQTRPKRIEKRFSRTPAGYNPNDNRPQELNGLGDREDVYQVYLGGELVYEEIKVSGPRPNIATFDETSDPGSTDTKQCSSGGSGFWDNNPDKVVFRNNWKTRLFKANTIKHISGRYLITRTDRKTQGEALIQKDDGSYVVYPSPGGTATFNSEVEVITNTELPDPQHVCPANYEHVITEYQQRINEVRDIDVGLELVGGVDRVTSPDSSSLTVGTVAGNSSQWVTVERNAELVQDQLLWTQTEAFIDDPQQARWIFWDTENIEITAEVEVAGIASKYGENTLEATNVRYCYTTRDARRYGDLLLRQAAGLYGSLIVDVPWYNPIGIGDSVEFTWDTGLITRYICVRIIEAGVADPRPTIRKSLLLLEAFD